LLAKIEQQGGSIKYDSLSSLIANDYINEHKLVKVRITEQLQSGTIDLIDGCVRLTKKGRLAVQLSDNFRNYMLPKKRLLMNDYSNELINPLANGAGAIPLRSCD
jgi:hypothetical protein